VLAAAFVATGALCIDRRRPAVGVAMAGLACAGLLLIALIGQPMDAELQTIKERGIFGGRAAVWQRALHIWPDFPVFGVGPEAFRMVSPRYIAHSRDFYPHHAESTFLEIALDTGLLGSVAVLLLAVTYGRCLRSSLRHDLLGRTARTTLLGAAPVLLLHAVFDYPLHVPLYGYTAAIILGLGVSARPRWRGDDDSPQPDRSWISWILPAAGLALVLAVAVGAGRAIGERDRHHFVAAAPVEVLLDNLYWAPTYWATWHQLGLHALRQAEPDYDAAVYCLERAVQHYPAHAELRLILRRVTTARDALAARRPVTPPK
jgi:O-antigen ligase